MRGGAPSMLRAQVCCLFPAASAKRVPCSPAHLAAHLPPNGWPRTCSRQAARAARKLLPALLSRRISSIAEPVRQLVLDGSATVTWPSSRRTTARALRSLVPVCSMRSEEHTSELQSRENLVCRLLLEK